MDTVGKNQYSSTPITDFYLDIANLPTADRLMRNAKINYITVGARHQSRLDLLSYDLYGTSNFWWALLILNINQIQDPIRDLKPGMILRYVSLDTLNGAF